MKLKSELKWLHDDALRLLCRRKEPLDFRAKLDRDMAQADRFPMAFKREVRWPVRLAVKVVRRFTDGGRECTYSIWSFARWEVKLVIWRAS